MKQPLKERNERLQKELALKNRELEIEAALEKVRSRTMAMQKSEELAETSFVLFQQFKKLGETSEQISIGIFNKEKNIMELYSTLHGSQWKEAASIDLKEPVVVKKIYDAWKKKRKSLVIDLTGSELKKYNKYRNSLSGLDYKEKRWVIHVAFFSKGAFTFSTIEPLPKETIQLLKRFAGVFDGTFTRFLDLQKAEAQARESQIQLALERVRARTMAMQHSDELADAASLLFKQFEDLGIKSWSSGFNIWQDDGRSATINMCNPDGSITNPYHLPHTEDIFFIKICEARQRGDDLLVMETGGKELEETYNYMFSLPEVRKVFVGMENTGFPIPKFQVTHCAFFSQGYLMFITYEPVPEMWDIFKRFAKVFGQTYTRFLDLQKAEAQAREAQIELGLERVRAKAMAMQNSEELKGLIGTVFTELTKLDLVLTRCVIWIFDPQTNGAIWWMANSEDPQNPINCDIPFNAYEPYLAFLEQWKKKAIKFQYELKDGIKKDWDKYLFSKTGLSRLPNFVIAGMKAPERILLTASFNNFGAMNAASLEPLSDEHADILLRFAKVFDLTYTRFNDLKQAEAQARESQIQLALERVRARTMAMQQSDELPDAANILFQQVQALGMPAWSAGYCIWDDDKKAITLWMSSAGIIQKPFRAPVTEDPSFIHFYDEWKRGETFYVEEIGGNAIVTHYQYMLQLPVVGEMLKQFIADGGSLPTFQIFHLAFFSQGFLLFITYEPVPEAYDIFKRFASVFEQTYTRFLDLQKAEAQAREARIEMALEKVRAESMAMSKSEDLALVVSKVFNELEKLEVKALRCGIGIINGVTRIVKTWVTTSTNVGSNMDISGDEPLSGHPLLDYIFTKWKEQKSFSYILEGNDLIDYYKVVGNTDFQREFAKEVLSNSSARHFYHCVMFPAGGLFTFSETPFSEDTCRVLKRFADAFYHAYKRFEDLQKAEAQARESQIQLALERVRARTMAMQKSDELSEAVYVLFQQFKELGENPDQATIGVVNEDEKVIEYWVTMHGNQINKVFKFPIDEPNVTNKIYNAWKKNKKSLVIDLSGSALREFMTYRAGKGGAAINPKEKRRVINVAFFTKGLLNVQSNEERSEESIKLLERFASVFEQTYTRFLDLQKAEAQARESKIELSLERVRAKTMAMHNSQDVGDTVATMFAEFVHLGIQTNRCGIVIFNDKPIAEVWTAKSNPEGKANLIIGKLDMNVHALLNGILKAWEKKETSYTYIMEGDDLINYYQALNNLEYYPVKFDMNALPSKEFHSDFYFPEGSVFTFTAEPIPNEASKVIKRFAAVFGQTYRRYLDLQKAEAQAREAQIEVALEKVRSRTMGMRKSDELLGAAELLYKELTGLGLASSTITYSFIDKEEKNALYYGVNPLDGKVPSVPTIFPHTETKVMRSILSAWKKQEPFLLTELDEKATLRHQAWVGKYIQASFIKNNIDTPFSLEVFLEAGPKKAFIYTFNFTQGYIFVIGDVRLTTTQEELVLRFTKVFELTYRRFLDLKQAEEQAREAQIEAALERVRSRSMGMQKSEELKEVIQVVYEQFVHLNINVEHTGFIMDYKERDDMHIWLADQHLVPSEVFIPYFDSAHWNSFNEAKEKGTDFFATLLNFEEKNKFYKDLFALIPGVPEETLEYYFSCPGLAGSTVLLDNVSLYIENFQGIPYTDEENNTLMRFGKVFQQTYTRFLDLQKAEAQAREAQIEVALERVRAKAMAMHTSNDLKDVARELRRQMGSLGLKELETCAIHLYEGSNDFFTSWAALQSPGSKSETILTETQLPRKGVRNLEKIIDCYNKKKLNYVIANDWKDFQQFSQTLKEHSPEALKVVLETTRNRQKNEIQSYWSVADFNGGSLLISSVSKPEQAYLKLLRRFANVFDLAYRRFSDLKKAEAQAREAEIQLALERVRARTMAMQKSEDLNEAASDMFKQIQSLGMQPWGCGFNIFDKDEKAVTQYMSLADGGISPPFRTPLTEDSFFINIYEGRQRGYELLVWESKGEALAETYRYMFGLPGSGKIFGDLENSGFEMPKFQITHCAYFSQGYLVFITYEPVPEAYDIFKRFAKVFEQTYTRFLDLQKAEAQAREAKIELSLERVRAKAMAMQSSDELSDVLAVLFEQFDVLGIWPVDTHLDLFDFEKNIFIYRATGKKGARVIAEQIVDLDSRPEWQALAEKWRKSKPNSIDLSFYPKEVIRELMDFFPDIWAAMPEDAIMDPEDFPDGMFDTLGYHKFGYLGFHHHRKATEEEKNVLIRFANEFERLYQRFLDLQKAEAQAREGQIQLAMERVRARTMAMQKSDELADVAGLLFKQLSDLGITAWTKGFNVWSDDNNSYTDYITSPLGGFIAPYTIDTVKAEVLNEVSDARKRGEEFFVQYAEGERLKEAYIQLAAFGDEKQYDKMLKDGVQFPSHQYDHFVFGSKVSLMFITYEPVPEAHDIFKRFGKVFEQTYTRFLDLQKAEAQAREAKIEVALERVRSRTMAMHQTSELQEVINSVHKELVHLDLSIYGGSFVVINDEVGPELKCWGSGGTADTSEEVLVPDFNMPFCTNLMKAIKGGPGFFTEEFSQKDKKKYFTKLFEQKPWSGLSDKQKKETLSSPGGYTRSVAASKHTSIFIINHNGRKFTDGENDILKRFAKVFEQTYTRFLDLQKAESQAREAIRQASLDRVRGQIASMRSTEDLNRITPLIWHELTALGVPFIRCGVFIIDESNAITHVYLSSPDGHSLAVLNLPFNSSELTKNSVENWRKGLVYHQHWNKEEFINWTKSMMEMGQIQNPETYQGAATPPESLDLHFVPFTQGMLYVGNTSPLAEDEIDLVKSLAEAFSIAYARYEDFNKLEKAKESIEITLTELKATQKQLVQSEKMASLGELTAGIAHEIQNPLNFVNNFSDVNKELLVEMKDEMNKGNIDDANAIANDVIDNEEKINHHGKRAGDIVKGMLQHSRSSTGVKEPTNINALADEYLRLSYHGLRAKDKDFNATMKTDFDENIGKINIIPQDIGRVLLNLYNNAFYAVKERHASTSSAGQSYEPTVSVTTKKSENHVIITVSDNGNGIPQKIVDKIFQPFFTTKPTGQGTGLGLSLSYDIVKAHGGEIKVESKEGEGSIFVIQLLIPA